MRPQILVSTWKPWKVATWPQRVSIPDQVTTAIALGVDGISMKGTNLQYVYGKQENLIWPYSNHSNDHIEREAKSRGLKVALWCYVELQDPAAQARAIHDAVARWSPIVVKLDVERKAKLYGHNTGAFLRSLGILRDFRGERIPVVDLESYYKPDVHPEIEWVKWLTYQAEGKFIISGVAPQAYYMQSQNSVGHYTEMLRMYRRLENLTGRTFDWHITLPTFAEHGWAPTAESLKAGIDFLREELGDRLVGVEYWRLGWLLKDEARGLREMLQAYDWGEPEPPLPPEEPTPFEELPEPQRWGIVGEDLRERGVVEV